MHSIHQPCLSCFACSLLRFTIPANAAMAYGTHSEPHAMRSYQGLVPHEQLSLLGLRVWRDDDVHGWLAASPDGLISLQAGAAAGLSGVEANWLRQQTGVLRACCALVFLGLC
jgi:hypothetical protein